MVQKARKVKPVTPGLFEDMAGEESEVGKRMPGEVRRLVLQVNPSFVDLVTLCGTCQQGHLISVGKLLRCNRNGFCRSARDTSGPATSN